MNQQRVRAAQRMIASIMLAAFVFSGALFAGVLRVGAATPPNIVSYQGRLLNTNGVPVSDATASISFALYSALSGGSCLWSNNSDTCASVVARTVTLSDGLFSESLGDTTDAVPYAAIGDAVFANNTEVYLEVVVNGETLTPRKRLLSAPFAINASLLDGFNTTQAGGTSAFVTVLDTNGNLQLTGSPQGSGIGQGSLYINPASGVVAADEMLFGLAVNGVRRLTVDVEGDTALAGDFIVGGSTLIAPFSVDESVNTVRIGDGANDANTPAITFFASDAADSGTLSYADDDVFAFSGGNVNITGLGTLPTSIGGIERGLFESATFTGTSLANLTLVEMYGAAAAVAYSAVENATSTDHLVSASESLLTISGGTATVTRGFGSRSRLVNTSTNASLVQGIGYLAGSESEFVQMAAATTVADAYGMHAKVSSEAGTLTNGSAVFGEVVTAAGSLVNGYAGRFSATAAGTNRYGIFAQASGGTSNYSGYFTGAQLQIDDDATPDVPTYATGSGDLYASGDIENRGSTSFGDASGSDQFQFVSGVTTLDVLTVNANSLTTGAGMSISRAAGGADYDGSLLSISQLNVGGDATAVNIVNNGGGNSIGLHILQNTLSAHINDVTGNNGLVIDTNDAPGNEDALIIRSDVDGTPDTEFRVESDGDVFGDGATYTSGADYAEFFRTTDAGLGDYHVVCQDPTSSEGVRRCLAGDTTYVMGVVSTNPAFVGNNFRGASYDLSNDANYRKVGMVGQIDTLVNANEGAIAIGDAITTSMTMTGYGAKAHGPSRIVGFALEPLSTGVGTVRVLVQPQWYGGDVLTSDGAAIVAGADIVVAPLDRATATASSDSHDIVLRGSGWQSGAAVTKAIALRTSVADGSSAYRLSVVNDDGGEVAYIGQTGDIALAGRLYPSDRGTLQESKYIYYDGSSGSGGDFMRTNASGWGSGSYDFAEMFPSRDTLAAGEVVVFAHGDEEIMRSTGVAYDDRIAGVVSTRPGFLAGENKNGDVPVALVGRVPTYVSGENGAIAIGDPLTTATKPGYAMKATEPGPIVGYAMEAFSGVTGVVTTFIRPSYFDGSENDAPIADNSITNIATVGTLDISGSLNMNGGSILSVASLSGLGSNWEIDEAGDILTRGTITTLVTSYTGDRVPTYPALGREHTVQLSGTSLLRHGAAHVLFEDVDPLFNDIIAHDAAYRVLVTPAGVTGVVYATERTSEGFVIRDSVNTDGVAVDWLVIAYQKDFAPEVVEDTVVAEDEQEAPVVEEGVTSESTEEDVSEEDIVVDGQTPVSVEEEPSLADDTEVVVDEQAPVDSEEVVSEPTAQPPEELQSENTLQPTPDVETTPGVSDVLVSP